MIDEVFVTEMGRAEPSVGEEPMIVSPEIDMTAQYRGYQALVSRSVDVFGDELTASRWLSVPSVDLNGAIPLEAAKRLHFDPREVNKLFEPIFIRIEHGIYA